MFKTRARENVYIIEKIVKNLNEFVLFSAMYYNFASLININIVFLSVNNIVKFTFTNLTNVNIDSININSDLINVVNKLATIDKINYN